jgi:hypothetical protein
MLLQRGGKEKNVDSHPRRIIELKNNCEKSRVFPHLINYLDATCINKKSL